ncbi:hypothetical protein CCUS01_14785 [Colletotrichum cuscutae]|uniref:Uncharacterized protein n=1 Tax=Colletotrichum cuscutae TaxID=1209917 RepID=A0AAI9VI16_9PEZI|nr:hypothetical protein CCUS01_14785 [Colletotrichum cuscutae]
MVQRRDGPGTGRGRRSGSASKQVSAGKGHARGRGRENTRCKICKVTEDQDKDQGTTEKATKRALYFALFSLSWPQTPSVSTPHRPSSASFESPILILLSPIPRPEPCLHFFFCDRIVRSKFRVLVILVGSSRNQNPYTTPLGTNSKRKFQTPRDPWKRQDKGFVRVRFGSAVWRWRGRESQNQNSTLARKVVMEVRKVFPSKRAQPLKKKHTHTYAHRNLSSACFGPCLCGLYDQEKVIVSLITHL